MAQINNLGSLLRKQQEIDNINEDKVYYCDAKELNVHPQNVKFYNEITAENLTDLKAAILAYGKVAEPIIVTQKDDKKYIIAGNRRKMAVEQLFNEGKLKSQQVPYKLKQYQNEDDELRDIILLNAQREKTVSERRNEINYLYDFYAKEKDVKNIKGNTRKYIADKIGISETLLQRYRDLDKLSNILQQKLDEEDISISMAMEFIPIGEANLQDAVYQFLVDNDDLSFNNLRKIKRALKEGFNLNDLDEEYNVKQNLKNEGTDDVVDITNNATEDEVKAEDLNEIKPDDDTSSEISDNETINMNDNDDATRDNETINMNDNDDATLQEPVIEQENDEDIATDLDMADTKDDSDIATEDDHSLTEPENLNQSYDYDDDDDGINDDDESVDFKSQISDEKAFWKNILTTRMSALNRSLKEADNDDDKNHLQKCINFCKNELLSKCN